MSSSITLSAATRQNLLSLQDTASLLSTTQNRLSTGKKVNTALDNPINFFTSQGLSARSSDLASLLDGISNGIQTIQAANTGITKLRGLTDQLKSVAQQALASSNAFTTKAQSVSGALSGATATNLLSTGPTQAVSDLALGAAGSGSAVAASLSASADYQPSAVPAKTSFAYTASTITPASVSVGTYTATSATQASATGATFSPPANAVASTYTGSGALNTAAGASTLTITLNGGTAQVLNVAQNASVSDIQTAITNNTALSAAGVTATLDSGALKISANNGSAFTVQGSISGLLGDTTAHAQAVTGSAAGSQTLTITGASGGPTAITLTGGNAGTTAKTITDAINAVNAQTTTTGVSAAASGSTIALTGSSAGAQFTVQGGTGNGFGFSTTAATTANGVAAASQTLTLTLPGANGGAPTQTTVTIPGGTARSALGTALTSALGASGYTATVDSSTGAVSFGRADGQNFSVAGSSGNTVSGVANTGTPTTATSTNGLAAPNQTVTINGTAVTIAGGANQAGALAAINAMSSTTGVSAQVDPSDATKIQFVGKTDGSSFAIQGGTGNTFGSLGTTSTTVTGSAGAVQSVTLNGTQISIAATATKDQAIAAINAQSALTGVTAAAGSGASSGRIVLSGGADGSSFTVMGSPGNTLGITATASTVTGTFRPAGTTLASAIGFQNGDSFTVNGQTVTVGSGETLSSLAQKVTTATNDQVSAAYDPTARKFSFTAADAATAVMLGNGSTATSRVSNLGFSPNNVSFAAGEGAPNSTSPLAGQSLTVQAGNGPAVSVTFGTGAGQVQSLTQLNTMLAGANAQASLDAASGKLSITTTNDHGAEALTVTASGPGSPFNSGTSSAVVGGDGATARSNLVTNFNNLLNQINQLAGDSGYNGVNLLAGDDLKLAFNEKSTSSLVVQGTTVNATNLGLSAVGSTDFQENASINKIIDKINSAGANLNTQAATLGSNLAIVQNRQDFNKQMINVLDTGAANLTDADLNEEAANSQALSTRNSLAVSALSLANQSQQSILQLLR